MPVSTIGNAYRNGAMDRIKSIAGNYTTQDAKQNGNGNIKRFMNISTNTGPSGDSRNNSGNVGKFDLTPDELKDKVRAQMGYTPLGSETPVTGSPPKIVRNEQNQYENYYNAEKDPNTSYIGHGVYDLNTSGINRFIPQTVSNTMIGGQLNDINNRIAGIENRPTLSMQAANAAGANIDQSQQAQFRNQQLALGRSLMDQANGNGPSVAGSQLRQSTEMNLQAALAQASSSRGGNLGAAQYQLGNARANIQQQAAQQLAQTRIQEQMAARSQLGDVLNAGRGADIGLATTQAQLTQQGNQFNAGLQQQTNAANLGSAQEQQAHKDALTQSYLAMGYNLEQANRMAELQQVQYNAGVLNSAEAVNKGIALQQNAQNIQLAGGIASAVGGIAGGVVGSMGGPVGTAAGSAAGALAGRAIGEAV